MKITSLTIGKETSARTEYKPMLVCDFITDTKEHIVASHPWVNTSGLWASDDEARDPREVAAFLRNFAGAIERWAKKEAA